MSGADAAGREAVRRADRLEFAGAGRHFASRCCKNWCRRRRERTTIRSTWRRSPRPRPRAFDARGLLVRVGAYFHDIGKMLKPAYFVENQGNDNSRHDTLVPAMSTLIIIAHVKDGADLARQHHLPEAAARFHPAASRHDAGRVFLPSGQRAQRNRSRRRRSRRERVPLSRARSRRPRKRPC